MWIAREARLRAGMRHSKEPMVAAGGVAVIVDVAEGTGEPNKPQGGEAGATGGGAKRVPPAKKGSAEAMHKSSTGAA